MPAPSTRPLAALTAAVSLGLTIFFTLYSLVPVTRADSPGLSSLFLGTMMAFVMGVQAFTPALVGRFSLRFVLAGSVGLAAVGGLITGMSASTSTLLIGAVAGGAGFGTLIVAGAQGVALLVPADKLGRALGVYGLITMAASALGSPLGVQLALTFSPAIFGVCALFAGIIAAGLSFGVPAAVGRVSGSRPAAAAEERGQCAASGKGGAGRLRRLLADAPWLVLCFLLLGIIVLSHGLSSLPVLASAYAAVVIFSVQAGNALGRWLGGELEARSTTGVTIVTGAVLLAAGGIAGVLAAIPAVVVAAGGLVGLGVGIVQTVTLHTAMRLMDAGRASVMWNLSVDGGLWTGGILWGLALTSGFVEGGVLLVSTLIVFVSVTLVLQLRRSGRSGGSGDLARATDGTPGRIH